MVTTAFVKIWGETVGATAWDGQQELIVFFRFTSQHSGTILSQLNFLIYCDLNLHNKSFHINWVNSLKNNLILLYKVKIYSGF